MADKKKNSVQHNINVFIEDEPILQELARRSRGNVSHAISLLLREWAARNVGWVKGRGKKVSK